METLNISCFLFLSDTNSTYLCKNYNKICIFKLFYVLLSQIFAF